MHPTPPMSPHVDVKFARMSPDPSVEASVQRWVDRLGWTNVEIERASVSIERTGWRRTSACLELVLGSGKALTAKISRTDIYVAVADVFREARKQLLGLSSPSSGSLAISG
jgi:ribosome-associated translation inhibitor RaiA